MAASAFGEGDLATGTVLSLTTSLGEQILGATVLAFDPDTECLLLREPGAHNGVATIRIVKATQVKAVTSSTKPAADFKDPLDPLPVVDLEKCHKREERAIKQAELEASRVGEGVTKEAQAIFEALIKTMPSRWQGKSILVLDEVLVPSPYTPEAATILPGIVGQASLTRVQKVLTAERKRLGL